MECPGRVTADSIILTQKRSAYVTGDKVTVQCVTGYTLDSVSILPFFYSKMCPINETQVTNFILKCRDLPSYLLSLQH